MSASQVELHLRIEQILTDARDLGWPGTIPKDLNSYAASRAMVQASAFLKCHIKEYEALIQKRFASVQRRGLV